LREKKLNDENQKIEDREGGWFSLETLQSPAKYANRNERQGHAKNSPYQPNIVKVSTIDAGPRSAEVMMKASSGPSPAPWRFRGIAGGTVVIAHPGKVAPAKAAPGTDCATHERALAAL
jgi:hypothetical protein